MDIGAYTLGARGEDQTISYIDDLERCCQQLADNPALAAPAAISGPACAEWNTVGMSCFTGSKPRVP
jgi:plasmid stabilization system protein ParE